MEQDDTIFVKCDCWAHGIHLDVDNDHKIMYLSFWVDEWYAKKIILWEKLKLIWSILRHGDYFLKEIVLRPKEAGKLRDWLSERLDKWEDENC